MTIPDVCPCDTHKKCSPTVSSTVARDDGQFDDEFPPLPAGAVSPHTVGNPKKFRTEKSARY